MLIRGDRKLQGNAKPRRGSAKEKEELNAPVIAPMKNRQKICQGHKDLSSGNAYNWEGGEEEEEETQA